MIRNAIIYFNIFSSLKLIQHYKGWISLSPHHLPTALKTKSCHDANFAVIVSSGATSDNKVGTVTTLGAQCIFTRQHWVLCAMSYRGPVLCPSWSRSSRGPWRWSLRGHLGTYIYWRWRSRQRTPSRWHIRLHSGVPPFSVPDWSRSGRPSAPL